MNLDAENSCEEKDVFEFFTNNALDPAGHVLTFICDGDPNMPSEITWNTLNTDAILRTAAVPSFQLKPPITWTTDDIRDWMHFSAVENLNEGCVTDGGWDIKQMYGERWQDIDGPKLCSMQVAEFVERDPCHGQLLFDLLHLRSIHEPFGQYNDDMLYLKDVEIDETFDKNQLYPNVNGGLPGINSFIRPSLDHSTYDSCLADNDQIGGFHSGIFGFGSGVAMTTQLPGEELLESESDEMPSPNLLSSTTSYSASLHNLLLVSPSELSSAEFYPTSGNVTSSKCRRQRQRQRPTTAKTIVRPLKSDLSRRRLSSGSSNYTSDDACSSIETSIGLDTSAAIIRRKTKKRAVHLWQFMLSLLDDDRYNPKCVKWLNTSDGVFRIVNSAEIARLWGIKKNNRSMTFEKMSRSLRWSRDNGFLSDVPKNGGYPKKLCFRFGELAENWYNSPSAISGCLGN